MPAAPATADGYLRRDDLHRHQWPGGTEKGSEFAARQSARLPQQVEALFLQMMLKSMRDATAAIETDSNEMGMYQDMFDKQVALSISQHADLGIGSLLKRQLAGKTAPAGANDICRDGAHCCGAAATSRTTPAEFVDRCDAARFVARRARWA